MIQLKKVLFVVGFIEKSYLQVGGVKWVYMLDNLKVYLSVIKDFATSNFRAHFIVTNHFCVKQQGLNIKCDHWSVRFGSD